MIFSFQILQIKTLVHTYFYYENFKISTLVKNTKPSKDILTTYPSSENKHHENTALKIINDEMCRIC